MNLISAVGTGGCGPVIHTGIIKRWLYSPDDGIGREGSKNVGWSSRVLLQPLASRC